VTTPVVGVADPSCSSPAVYSTTQGVAKQSWFAVGNVVNEPACAPAPSRKPVALAAMNVKLSGSVSAISIEFAAAAPVFVAYRLYLPSQVYLTRQ